MAEMIQITAIQVFHRRRCSLNQVKVVLPDVLIVWFKKCIVLINGAMQEAMTYIAHTV
jgi:hypothetical protein